MKWGRCIPIILRLILFFVATAVARAAESPPPSNTVVEVQFSQSAPYASISELKRRMGFTLAAPAYDITRERFRVCVPEGSGTNSALGLLVWISPGDEPHVPASWLSQLASRHLVFVAAVGGGNSRHTIDRCRLALDATCNLCRQYTIDPRHIYIAGFSGGGRMASILGVAYADVFSGTIAICGVDFYQNVVNGNRQFYPASYRPTASVLLRAQKQCRFVLLTGENDMNRENTKWTSTNGFLAEGFQFVRYIEVPGMSHQLPSAEVLGTALDYLMPAPKS